MIDSTYLARQTGDDVALQREVLALFAQQMQALERLMEDAARRMPAPAHLEAALHRYWGAGAAVGASELVGELAQAEQALAAGRLSAHMIESLRSVAARTRADANRLMAAWETGSLAKNGERL